MTDEEKTELRALVSAHKKAEIAEGLRFVGDIFDVDANSRAAMVSKLASMGDNDVVNWKLRSGKVIPLKKVQLAEVHKRVEKFIQAVYDAEAVALRAIDNGHPIDLVTGWPAHDLKG